ncbi:MAG: hypothetical protein R3Y06_11765 [Faecalibacterium sp.]
MIFSKVAWMIARLLWFCVPIRSDFFKGTSGFVFLFGSDCRAVLRFFKRTAGFAFLSVLRAAVVFAFSGQLGTFLFCQLFFLFFAFVNDILFAKLRVLLYFLVFDCRTVLPFPKAAGCRF